MPVKRNKLDIVHSDIIRERVNYNCERCHNNFRNGGLDCSHVVPRRHVATKWHPLCSVAHCRSCHRILTDSPIKHTRWSEEYFGVALVDEMTLVANTPVKWTKAMREDIYRHMRLELKQMEIIRAAGVTKEIPYTQHEYMHEFDGGRPV